MKITKSKLKQIIKEELVRFAEGEGLVSFHRTTNPEFDNIVDITKSALEINPQAKLLQIADALRKDPSEWKTKKPDLMSGVLVIDGTYGKYAIGKPEKFKIASDDEFVEVGEYVIGTLG